MKYLIWAVLLFVSAGTIRAQDVYTSSGKSGYHHKTMKKKKGYDPSKLIIGGGISFDMGDGYLIAGASPIIGYMITKNLAAGVGLGYQYSQMAVTNDPRNPSKYLYQKDNFFYPNLWTRYFIWRNWYATGQFEYDLIRDSYPIDNMGNINATISNVTNPCLLMGAGYRAPMSGRVSFFIEALYDVLQGKNSPYGTSFPSTFRVGIAAGL